jgi:hypothetical protein
MNSIQTNDPNVNNAIQEVYHATDILRRPVSGIVSGYHQLPYILISPDDENASRSIQINGRIDVSPRFVISAQMMADTFGEVFDPETFDKSLEGRFFSFAYSRSKNVKVENQDFEIRNFDERAQEHVNRVHDDLQREENVRTALIFGPRFHFYPVSLDRFLNEIIEREFRGSV